MTAIQRKIVRDLWQERLRTVMAVVAMAIGIAGFTAVLSAYAILTRELNKEYLASNPPSAVLTTDRVDGAMLQAVLASGTVRDAEARRVLLARMKTGPIEWRSLVLFVIPDFTQQRIAKLSLDKGKWPPNVGDVLIERNAFQVAHARIGDTALVKIGDLGTQRLRIAGSVHDVGQAQARMENIVYGYITPETMAQLGQGSDLDELNIVVAGDRFDGKHIEQVTGEVKAIIEKLGHLVARVDIPTPGKHPHAKIMEMLLIVMSIFGFAILLLSCVVISNLLTALLAAHIRQIGMMKAIGARRRQIAGIYFGEVAVLGAAAVVVGLPGGIWGGRVLCKYLAVLLNFDMSSFALPAWVYLAVFAAGVVTPLAIAVSPILKGTAITVREALAEAGVSGESFGTTRLERMLLRVGGGMRLLSMVMRNVLRRRSRFELTVATFAAGGVFFLSALNIRASLIHTIDRIFAARPYDLSVRFDEAYPQEKLQHALRGVPGVMRTDYSLATRPPFSHGAEPTSQNLRGPQAKPEQPGIANTLRIAFAEHDEARLNRARVALDRNFELDGLRAVAATTKAESRYGFDQHMLMIFVFLIIASSIIAAVGGLSLMTTATLNVMERRREMGVMRAMGATPRVICLLVMSESVMTALISWCLAALIAWPLSKAVGGWIISSLFQTGLDFRFEVIGLVVWLTVSLVLAIAASVIPAVRAARVSVHEAIAWS